MAARTSAKGRTRAGCRSIKRTRNAPSGRTVTGLLVKTGARQNDLEWAERILLHRDERLQSNLSLERDVDVARVAADLSRAEASYQASLLVTSKLFENNLIQYLR